MENKLLQSAFEDYSDEDYPTKLYSAIMKNDWEAALTECFTNPEQASVWVIKHASAGDGDGGKEEKKILTSFLPLHAAMARNAPHQTAVAILMAYPEAVKKPDHRGMLPLHYACASGAPEQRIAMLLMIYQQGARTMDTVENSLPIHQLCQRRILSEEAFRLLLIANPESIDAKDINGKTPLDIITAKHGAEDAARLEKLFKLISLAIGMNVDVKADRSHSVKKIANLEKMLKDEKLNREQEIELLKSGIGTLQVQADYLQSSNSSMETQLLELQNAMARVVGVQQETEAKLLEALSNVAKLQAEVGVLEQGKRSLEERLNEIGAAEQMWKRELFRLTNLLKIYSDCNSMLKSKAKSLNIDIQTKNEEVNETSKKLNACAESCDSFCQDVFSQLNLIKSSAKQREMSYEELLHTEKRKKYAEKVESTKSKLEKVSVELNSGGDSNPRVNNVSSQEAEKKTLSGKEHAILDVIYEAQDENDENSPANAMKLLSPLLKMQRESSCQAILRSPPQ
jgi:ankyrin repeat protein